MRNLVLALVTWTLIALGMLALSRYQIPPGCGIFAHPSAECIANNTSYMETHSPGVIYRYPMILLAFGYLILFGFAWSRRRRK